MERIGWSGENKGKFTEKEMMLLKKAFGVYGKGKGGKIYYRELNMILKEFGIEEVKEEDGEEEKMTFDDFVEVMAKKFAKGGLVEGNGVKGLDNMEHGKEVNINKLKKSLNEINENYCNSELQSVIEKVNASKNGNITNKDFLKIIEKTYLE